MKDERGFTLVELLLGAVITAVVVSFLGFMVFQTFQVEEFGSAQITARNELQNAAAWMQGDAVEAKTAAGGSQLTLTMPDASIITYAKSGTDLTRTSGSTVNTIARNISAATFSVSGRLVTVDLTSTPPGRSGAEAQGTYIFNMRPTL
ncbi:MAG: prepilin-type N-terminal cleavage/methylation domain-containing protein [Chloroflexota bacterium]